MQEAVFVSYGNAPSDLHVIAENRRTKNHPNVQVEGQINSRPIRPGQCGQEWTCKLLIRQVGQSCKPQRLLCKSPATFPFHVGLLAICG